jgi:CheY-like chemotaxis protein
VPGSSFQVNMMKSLLLVDDNDQIRELLRLLVADLAETIYECRNGAEAIALYATEQPTWVLMDIHMAVMNGLAATRHIVRQFPAAQVMIITGYDDLTMRAAARAAGACEFVAKDSLITVRQILSGQKPLPAQAI